jgi:hypothetical protein
LRAQPTETGALRFAAEFIKCDVCPKTSVQVAETLEVFLFAAFPIVASWVEMIGESVMERRQPGQFLHRNHA